MNWKSKLFDKILKVSIVLDLITVTVNFVLLQAGIRESSTSLIGALVGGLVFIFLFWANRQGYKWTAWGFVMTIIVLMTFLQPPTEAFEGSNILALVLPVIASSYLIEPKAVFVTTPIIILDLLFLAFWAGEGYWGVYPSPNTIAVIVLTAVIVWAGAVSAQDALDSAEESEEILKEKVRELEAVKKTLEEKVEELEVFSEAAVDRELRIAELKKRAKQENP